MPKAYWVVTYRSVKNPEAWTAHARLAVPAIEGAGGRFLARSNPAKIYESGMNERVVLVEFDSQGARLPRHRCLQRGAEGARQRQCRTRHARRRRRGLTRNHQSVNGKRLCAAAASRCASRKTSTQVLMNETTRAKPPDDSIVGA